MSSKNNSLNKTIGVIIGLGIILVVVVVLAKNDDQQLVANNTDNQASSSRVENNQTQTSNESDTDKKTVPNETEQLLYLIEEEKLAHDVYTVMYQKYGAQVFGNILDSESTHQGRVLNLLESREITDPRSSEVGVFKNTELQKLYDDLIAQGSQSATEAYKVGVAIEEKDIADITTQLETSTADDIVSALESLRKGSENHLRAFNSQLGRINN